MVARESRELTRIGSQDLFHNRGGVFKFASIRVIRGQNPVSYPFRFHFGPFSAVRFSRFPLRVLRASVVERNYFSPLFPAFSQAL